MKYLSETVENKNRQINQVSNELEEARGKIRFLNADAVEERELQGKEIIRQLNEQICVCTGTMWPKAPVIEK